MEVVPAQTRPWAQGISSIINGTLAIVGLVECKCSHVYTLFAPNESQAGGVAQMSAEGWRWVYYFNAIFFGLAAVLIGALYHPPPTKLRRENSIVDELKSVDIVGIVLLLCGVIGIVLGLTWGGDEYTWSSPQVIGTLVVGCCFLFAFGCFGWYHISETSGQG
jgi:MFS family permease